MGFGDSVKKIFGFDPIEDDELEVSQEEIDARKKAMQNAEQPVHTSSANNANKNRTTIVEPPMTGISQRADKPYEAIEPMMAPKKDFNKISMNGSTPFKMIIIEPKNFDECSKLVDNLKARKPVIINLEKVETELARKMFDFLSGATYALSGNVQRVTQNIFIFAPNNVDISAQLNRDATEAGYSNSDRNPWR
jgi:cell division inhibitor SepF